MIRDAALSLRVAIAMTAILLAATVPLHFMNPGSLLRLEPHLDASPHRRGQEIACSYHPKKQRLKLIIVLAEAFPEIHRANMPQFQDKPEEAPLRNITGVVTLLRHGEKIGRCTYANVFNHAQSAAARQIAIIDNRIKFESRPSPQSLDRTDLIIEFFLDGKRIFHVTGRIKQKDKHLHNVQEIAKQEDV